MIIILITAPISDLRIELIKGTIKPNKIRNVNITAICAINLFSFFIPGLIIKSEMPKNTGIKDVIDGVSDFTYPKTPKKHKKIELTRLE